MSIPPAAAASRTTSVPAAAAAPRAISAPAAAQPARLRSEPPPETAQPLPAEALSSNELRRRLDDPELRMGAIFELCRRGHPAAITPIFKVLGGLSPEDVATTVVCMLMLGAGVSGGLIECLDSPSQDVRHAAALGLGQLKVPETLLPLLRRIETETTPSWTEMARALGDYGGPALSIVVRALPSSDRRERLMVGLAHLANHGCAEELKSLENDPDSAVALASRQALARCARMRAEDVAVRTQQPLRDNSPEARFSQVFFATLAAAG
jgi:HEAT repeat protein